MDEKREEYSVIDFERGVEMALTIERQAVYIDTLTTQLADKDIIISGLTDQIQTWQNKVMSDDMDE